ncbi:MULTISPECIES: hypothetical protein [Brucella]|uniref:hypothetical protein n=1 Tax=Brucella TaxID=234 RepID=UPI0011B0B3CD|nr:MULTISPECIES: hypothetical protein [Brucella]MBK0021582.1 hypothetical protein [Ochrobactrum sp. S45]MBK0043597.1 hypothetical protein [Ochrobactrum sp. S46]MQP42860.1 hypothetical protein [Ochrobactrum sp. MYb237]UKK93956.1 hypothetical protein L7D45_17230 [Brucella pseudogrignonensis]
MIAIAPLDDDEALNIADPTASPENCLLPSVLGSKLSSAGRASRKNEARLVSYPVMHISISSTALVLYELFSKAEIYPGSIILMNKGKRSSITQ